jgi:transketolase
VFTIHGDGELQEGSHWEAMMSAAHHKLDNLIALVDRNGLQIDGKTSDVMEPEPLSDKWRSFGWHVLECDGNDIRALIESYKQALNTSGKPTVIIAKTLMGKGVPAIENDHRWHGRAPSPTEAEAFIRAILAPTT